MKGLNRMDLSTSPENFTAADLSSLRSELQHAGLDSWQAAELITAFLTARGYGVSNREARTAAARMEFASCSLECMGHELALIAMMM